MNRSPPPVFAQSQGGGALAGDPVVGHQVAVAAVLGQPVLVDREGLLRDVAELLQHVPRRRLARDRGHLPGETDRRVREEVGDRRAVVLEPGDDRVEVRQERIEVAQRRPELLQRARQRREAPPRCPVEVVEVDEQRAQVRREPADAAQRRADVVGDREQPLDQRARVGLEAVEPLEGEPCLVLERGGDLEEVAEGLLLGGEGAERLVGAGDRIGELAVALAERVEDRAGVADEALELVALTAQDREHAGGVAEERGEVADRVVEVEAAAADRDRRPLLPLLEGRAGLRVEGVEDLVDLGLVLDPADRERASLGDRVDVARPRLGSRGGRAERDTGGRLRPRARGELDVGLAEQGLLAQDRSRVARDRRELGLDLDLDLGGVLAADPLVVRGQLDRLHLADRHAPDPHVRLLGELRRLREVGVDPVALRLQRHRPAERDPEEQEQQEAREREPGGDQDPADRWR
jgi:hypothetical protein